MLKVDRRSLAEMEREHPGIWEAVRRFEADVLPPCPLCRSFDTAVVETAAVKDSTYLASATTKVKLLPKGPKPGAYYCNACGQYFG